MSPVREQCPLCGGASLRLLFARRIVPAIANRLYDHPEIARRALTGPLQITACHTCSFVFNRTFDPAIVKYDGDYNNEQWCSRAFFSHAREMASRICKSGDANTRSRILEIGCGQGQFLRELYRQGKGLIAGATGYDASWRDEATLPPGVRIIGQMFDAKAQENVQSGIDVIIARHVIEHVPHPVNLLVRAREVLLSSPQGRLFLETPSLEWIIRNRQQQDFFYEHCNYFTMGTLRFALDRAGFRTCRVDHVFSGQYLWAEAAVASGDLHEPKVNLETAFMELMPNDERSFIQSWRAQLARCKSNGPIAIWGAGAKGVTFANAIDPNCDTASCVLDINPAKHNKFIPVTAHPVLSADAVSKQRIGTIVIMNPNYKAEIEAHVRRVSASVALMQA